MGFFGRKKTIIVSSTVYNMAGEEADRPDFIKNSIYAAVMSPHNPWLGETISNNLLHGPGMNQRQFFKWCVRQDYPGLPTYSVTRQRSADPIVVGGEIDTPGSPAGLVIQMQSSNVVSGDYEHIAEAYVLENNPDQYATDYVTSYDINLNEITIQWFPTGSVTFSAGSYNPDKIYIVAEYYHYLPASLQSLVTGSTTIGVLTKPSTTGYNLDGSSNRGVTNYPMNFDTRVVTTYVGPGAPPDTDVTDPDSDNPGFDGLDETWSKVTYDGGDGNTEATISTEHFLEIYEYRQIYTNNAVVNVEVNEDTPSAGITQTITTWRDGQWLRDIFDWRIDTQETILREIIGGVKLFSYEEGTGNAILDALVEDVSFSSEDAEYFPFLPIRLENKSITHTDFDESNGGLYEITNRAYRRATGRQHRFSKLVTEVEDNADIDDIDYAFIHYGVAINVIEPACRAYMYIWLKNISDNQNTSSSYMDTYSDLIDTYLAEVADLNDWIFDQGDSGRTRYGDGRPSTPKLASLETTTVKLKPADAQMSFTDMRVTWINISESLHSGAPTNPDTQVAAVEGDIWMQDGTDLTWEVVSGIYPNIRSLEYSVEQLEMYWQTGSSNYKKLTIWGLVHNNFVYGGESVKTTGKEGLANTDPSGFIIPLHYKTMKDLGLKDATQMATANTHIVFNTFEIVVQRWYETFIGMLIIMIVIIAITVITGGLGAGAGVGILGTNAAVGAAVGLSGTAAILAGAIINALVAIAISKIVGFVSIAILGDKWGAIVAAVINLAISLGTSGVEFSNLTELLTTENIMAITSAIANGYEGYTQGAVAEMSADIEQSRDDFVEAMDKISKALIDLRSNNGLFFNPLQLTDSVKGNDLTTTGDGFIIETLDEFIHRTTMVGSDLVDLHLTLVNDYAKLSTMLP